jgi:hypothetical protein
MMIPICALDAKARILRSKRPAKVSSGYLSKLEVEASSLLGKLTEEYLHIDGLCIEHMT